MLSAQTIAATKPPFGTNWSPTIQAVAEAKLATTTRLTHAFLLMNKLRNLFDLLIMGET